MGMADTYKARLALAKAIGAVQATARELSSRPGLTQQEAFDMIWGLAFKELRDLEDYRIPGVSDATQ